MPRFKHGVLLFNGQAGQDSAEQALANVVPVIATHCHKLTIVQTLSPEEFKQACMDASYADVLFLMVEMARCTQLFKYWKDRVIIIGLLPEALVLILPVPWAFPIFLKEAAEEM
jgi:hypothetical protein